MADRQPAKEMLTLRKWLDQSLAEKKLKDDAAAIRQQLKEAEESRPFYPRDLTVVEPPMSFGKIRRSTTELDSLTRNPLPVADLPTLTKITVPVTELPTLTKITVPMTDFPFVADLPVVSSNETDDHSYVEHYLPCDVLSPLALVCLALCNELAELSWMQFLMLFWEKQVAALDRLMSRRMIERLHPVSWGCLYDLKLSLSTWATLNIHDKFASTKDMVCRLLNATKAAAVCVSIKVLDMMSKILNYFDIDLAPLRATVQLLFNGRPNALRIITATSPSVVDKLETYVEKRPPSAESRPKASFEAGLPEPRNEPMILGLPQSDSKDTSSDELVQHSSTPLPMPEPIDEQLLKEPQVGDTAGAEQDSQLLAPMANTEKAVYRWSFDELSETLTTIATFPDNASEPSNGFLAKVAFIRAHKSIIKLQADGLVYVGDMKGLVKQGVEDLTAVADFRSSRNSTGWGGPLRSRRRRM